MVPPKVSQWRCMSTPHSQSTSPDHVGVRPERILSFRVLNSPGRRGAHRFLDPLILWSLPTSCEYGALNPFVLVQTAVRFCRLDYAQLRSGSYGVRVPLLDQLLSLGSAFKRSIFEPPCTRARYLFHRGTEARAMCSSIRIGLSDTACL